MSKLYDVVIVGYGPVSQLFALALGRQGRSVAIVERWKERYPLPRAVSIDHELFRVLSANGLGALMPRFSHTASRYEWFNADWKELLALDTAAEAVSGVPLVHYLHQPTLEESIDSAVAKLDCVDLLCGKEALAIGQDADSAWVDIEDIDTGVAERITGRFVLGCDGANSTVRETIGGGRDDLGFQANWLVVDVLLKDGVTIEKLGIPPSGQFCDPARPTTIVPGGVRDGQVFRRWEFMLLPGTEPEEMEDEEKIWELLAPWANRDQVELVRHKVYNFRSLVANRWRDRRVLIAGDAAHVMPPFLGQGMCSGLRDVWNLAWRFDLVLDGKADARLLDGYQTERSPHVRQFIEMSIFLGKIICIPDEITANERDRAFFAGEHPPFPPYPILTQGLLRRDGQGQPVAGAGELSPHGQIAWQGRTGPMDDLTGQGFLLISREDIAVPDALRGIRLHKLVFADAANGGNAEDIDGRIVSFLDARGWSAMLVRPDFYIYGGAAAGEEASLLSGFASDLAAEGAVLESVGSAHSVTA
ncbi:bifunctional 3-(3-hydroxy-phenyl)propionate/3-hydroxycinnamic acid hydroxylase [Novosphingobium album (ex Hu et al. 2023)]|uniref:Bifunctional 3-(3-hydroxy-phenyl)propionate/3-hydroxycinnamic acid hydroxylase n=1 Tax=Novosphingobium album (ex Hu et al. 2023) TaxID=2930093 RepID=A0ABT0B6N3_9SPHN|nr:bifunctional 3-(3-hydroxy-phenyl)propionate/3-hydroxycinnamic acid hydroxylase [Novosphingobium album (ex Hu et al. 2023)]MCJ2180742.1 bifunctional 3-(3-hydroxy-phenyl)propionate/3-hydroxycinnamic acid hydroxylase [Novosphingobium album (ex Hu et al. 2023)]